MSSQSIFDQDINANGYLHSLVPLQRFLTIESHANSQKIYTVLCKSVHDIRINLANNDTIFGINEIQSVIDTRLLRIAPHLFLLIWMTLNFGIGLEVPDLILYGIVII